MPPIDTTRLQIALSSIVPIRLALVFGSVARGSARADSDIDIAVWTHCPLTADTKIRMIETIAHSTGRAVDLVDLSCTGHPLLGEILRDGVRIIGDASTQADLATRAVFDRADFFPYVQQLLQTRRQAWIG